MIDRTPKQGVPEVCFIMVRTPTQKFGDQDTTAILTFFQSAGDLAAKAAGVAVSASTINGTFGLESGIYLLGDDGIFQKVAVKK